MNNERAALNHLSDHEVSPAPENWSNILEELDRAEIGNLVRSQTAIPSSEWSTIEAKLKKKSNVQWRWIPVIILGLLLTKSYWQNSYSSDIGEEQLASLPLVGGAKKGPSVFTVPEGSVMINTDPHTPVISPEKKSSRPSKPIQQADQNNYLLVASEDGKPIRIPTKWSALSCCLSGENDSVECREQQNAWHDELATAKLGFQADPFLGLMELIDASNDR